MEGIKTVEYHAKKKSTRYKEQDAEKVAAYEAEISDIPPEKIAYVDETGIDSYLYREYGYAPKGQPVWSRISGRKYARVGIVAAKLGKDVIAASRYSGTMNHEMFESWFENELLPALPEGTVIVMDNASFHRKRPLLLCAQKHGFKLLFLPAYSPELNPIEHFWACLKRTLRKILRPSIPFDLALLAAFFLRDRINKI